MHAHWAPYPRIDLSIRYSPVAQRARGAHSDETWTHPSYGESVYVQSGDQLARLQQRLHNRQHNRERAGITHRMVWWQQHNKRREHGEAQAPYRDKVVPPPQQDYQSTDRVADLQVSSIPLSPATKQTFIPDPSRLFEGVACLGITKRERAHGITTIIPTGDVESFQRVADQSKSRSIESFLKYNRDMQQERNRSQTAHPAQHSPTASPAPRPKLHAKASVVSDDTREDADATIPPLHDLPEQRSNRPLVPPSQRENAQYDDEPARHTTAAQPSDVQVPVPHTQDRTQEFVQHFEKVTAGIQSRQEHVNRTVRRRSQPAGSRRDRAVGAAIGVHRRSQPGLAHGEKNVSVAVQRAGGGIASAHTTEHRGEVAAARQVVSESRHTESVHSDPADVPDDNDIDNLMSRKRNEHAHWTQSSVRRGSYFGMFEQEVVNRRRRELVETASNNKQEDLSPLPPRTPFAPPSAPPTRRYDGPPTRNRREHQNWSKQSSLRRGSYFGLYAVPSAQDHS